MERPEAYPITYGVLGLLAFMGPMSGYDIKQLFDHMLSPMWGAAHSQIYNELKRMRELDWVEMQREEQEARPDRKVYSITSTGQAALIEWQKQPAEVHQIRDELLLKVMFGTFAPPEALAENLRKALVEHEMRLINYRAGLQSIPPRVQQGENTRRGKSPYLPYTEATEQAADPFLAQITRFAIVMEETYIKWLHETLEMVEHVDDSC